VKIALLNVLNLQKKGALNKDLAGGFGTFSIFGSSTTSKMISYAKKKSINLPIISFAFLQAILKEKGHEIQYIEGDIVDKKFDLVLIYGSIVDFHHENTVSKKIKKRYPGTKVGFFGTFPTVEPDLFSESDFVIRGEAESFFLYEFNDLRDLQGIISVKKTLNLDDLPAPDFDAFPIDNYSYFPAIKEKPFLVLQASKGCPYSCSYYCAYGMIQGHVYRIRSAKKLVEDIQHLVNDYHIKGIQFRDPTFGLDRKQVIRFCDLLISRNIKIKFGIETRLDLLDKDLLALMFKAGLRSINVGIETLDENIAKMNKRNLVRINHQEEIIDFCKKIGIKISAFYLFGLKGDTKESIKKTIEYAIKLNTNIAQFVISCPYPGSKYYEELKSKNLIIENDFEKFNSMDVVFKHDNLTKEQIMILKDYAFRRYYFRIEYLIEFLKWRIREFWL